MEGEGGGLGQTHPLRHQQQEPPGLPPPQPHIRLRGAHLRGEENGSVRGMILLNILQVWTNSLGLISDSFHMFFDCTGESLY